MKKEFFLAGINKELCIACGRCKDVCGVQAISFNEKNGFILPIVDKEKCVNCGKCDKFCLFYDKTCLGLSEIPRAYKAYDNNQEYRFKSASGGMITNAGVYILENNIVQGIVTATFKDGKFQYVIVDNVEDFKKCRGSIYSPVESNDIWEKIRAFDGQLAFIGTPCWCEMVERFKAEANNKIKYIFGIVCGHMPSRKYLSRYLKDKSVNINDIKKIRFRGDGWPGGGEVHTSSSKITFKHTEIWSFKHFSSSGSYNNACMVCNDLWGKYSDLSFADYWNPKDMAEGVGYNLIISNTGEGEELLNRLKGNSTIIEVSINEAINTQRIPYVMKKNINRVKRSIIFDNSIKLQWWERPLIRINFLLKWTLSKLWKNRFLWNIVNRVDWKIVNKEIDIYEKYNAN